MKNRIPPTWVEGTASRQAHCDLPEGTYEREIGREFPDGRVELSER